MSTVVDQRVVKMQFDNREFEKNVSTTMSSLDKLKEKLRFKGATKGFEDIDSAAKNVKMSPLENSVEAVRVKFSALQILGVTALQDLANTAVQTGKRIASALTIDPVRTGFSEYETQIGAIQTILANTQSKGTTLDDVNKALDTLNTYADKTIYNFTEMTRNIGTFTAAGIDLQTSVDAIQGIANLAAVSGSTSQQASTAMYQLSQALSTGTVRLMDWNSVVNAGMGGQVFQDALKETARVHGVAIDEIIEKNGSFRDSLQDEWLTADILTETLQKFTMATEGATEAEIEANRAKLKSIGYTDEQIKGIFELADTASGAATKVKTFTQLWDTLKESAQSGWTQTWELIVGDFDEAKELLTGISDVIGGFINKTSEWRNNLLGGALSPYAKLVEKINEAGVSTGKFEEKFAEVAKSQGIAVDDLIKKHGSLKKAIMAGEFSSGTFLETIKKFTGSSKGLSEATEDNVKKLEEYQKLFDEVWRGDWGNGIDRINKMTEAGHDYAAIQDLINKHEAGHKLTLEDLNEVIADSTDLTDEQKTAMQELAKQAEETGTPISELIDNMEKPSGRVLLIESFKNAFSGLFTILKQIKVAWQDTFDPITSNHLYKAIVAINTFSQNLTVSGEQAEQFRRIFKGVFALLSAALTIVGGPLKWAFDALITVIKNTNLPILELAAKAGDAMVAFSKWVKENNIFLKVLEKLTPYLSVAAEAIKTWVNGLKEAENIPAYIAASLGKGLGNVVKFVMNLFKSLGDYIKGGMKDIPGNVISGLINGLKNGAGKIGQTIINLGKILIENFMSVLGIHSPSKVFFVLGGFIIAGLVRGLMHAFPEAWETIKSFAASLADKFGERFQNGFGGILDDVKAFGSKLKDILSKLDFGTLFVGGLYVSTMFIASKFASALSTLAAPFEGLSDMFQDIGKGLKTLFKSMSGFFKAAKWRMMSGAIINLAIAVAILAASVYALSTIKDTKALWNAVGAITALALVMTGLMIAVSKFAAVDVKGVAALASIALIAGALLMMVYVLKQIETLDTSRLLTTTAIFIGIMASLLILTKAIGKFTTVGEGAQIVKAHLMLFGMAALMLMMVYVMKQASKLDDSAIIKSIAVMGSITLLVLMMGVFARVSGEHVDKAGKMMLKMAVALGLMAFVIKMASMLDGNTVIKGLTVIGAVGLLFAALVAVSHLAGDNADKAGKMILRMAGAMIIMSVAIAIIGKIPSGDIYKAIGVMTAVGVLFSVFVAVSYFAGEHAAEAGKMILKMSIAMLILAGALFVISLLDPEGVIRATGVILALGAMFALILNVNKTARKSQGPIIAITIALGLLVGALIALTFIDPKKLIAPTISLGVLMGALALVLRSTSAMSKTIKMGPILALIGVIGLIGGLVIAMALIFDNGTLTKVIKATASIGTLMLTLAGTLKIISMVDDVAWKAIGAIAVMSLIVAELGIMFKVLELMNVNASIETAVALGVLLLALSYSLVPLAAVGATGPAAFIGIGALAALVGVIMVLIAAIGAMAIGVGAMFEEWAWLESKMDKGFEIIKKILVGIGSALGEGIGAIISGIGNQVMDALPGWGDNLASFITKISDATTDIPDGIGSKLAGLAGGLIALTAASVLDGLTQLFTLGKGGIGNLGDALGKLGEGIRTFSDKLTEGDGVNFDTIEKVAPAIDSVVDIANKLKGVGGLKGIWSGDNGLGRFGEELAELGPHLATYSKSITENGGINPSAIIASSLAVTGFVAIAKQLKGVGWLKQVFTGDNGLGRFGKELCQLGKQLVKYSGIITEGNIDTAKIKTSGEAVKVFADIASNLEGVGWLKQVFTGDNGLGRFGEELCEFGTSLVKYSKTITDNGGINIAAIETSAEAAKKLVDMYASTPKFGGFVSLFTADHDMSEFGNQLTDFGSGMRNFVTSTYGVTVDMITPAVDAAKKLVEMYDGTPAFGGFVSWFCADHDMSEFGMQLTDFGTGIRNFATSTWGVTVDTISGGVDAAKKLAEMYEVMPQMNGLFAGFGEHKDMSGFSLQLEYLATGMKKFIENTDGIGAEDVVGPVNAAKALSRMYENAPNMKGLFGIFGEGVNLINFGTQLGYFGAALKAYAWAVKDLDTSSINTSIGPAEDLMELTKKIPGYMVEDESIKNFAKQLDALGDGLKDYSNKVKGMNVDAVNDTYTAVNKIVGITGIITPEATGSIEAFSSQLTTLAGAVKKVGEANAAGDIESFASALPGLAESLKNFGDVAPEINTAGLENITEFINNIDNLSGEAKTAGTNIATNILKGIEDKIDAFKTQGEMLVLQLHSGVELMRDTLVTYFKNTVGACATGALEKYSAFTTAGAYLTMGFGAGIMAKKPAAVAAARNVANACAAIMRSALDEHSPSRVTYEIGEYFGQGFVNGIDVYASKSYDSAYGVADAAKDGLNTAVDKMRQVFGFDLENIQPRIKPVLDLSDIRAGAGTIPGLLDFGPSIGVLANVNDTASAMRMMNQNRNNNDELLDAIDNLRKDLNSHPTTSYNINGMSYNDDAGLKEAFETIIRVARMGRRT